MTRSALTSLLSLTAVLVALAAPAAFAQDFHHDGFHGGGPHGGDFHGGPGPGWHGDIHHFGAYDYGRWRGGNWFHGPHGGRDGWWWIVDGQWYFYSAPIYPYPDPYVPPKVVIPTAPPPNMQYVYYCSAPAGYYPYVAECLRPWHSRLIAVQAPPPVAVVPPPAPLYAAPPASMPVMPPVGFGGGTRELDDRQLNSFGAELDAIHRGDPHARSRLSALQASVEDFRQALFHRNYNAMDILHDTEDLEHRIAVKRAAFAGKKVAAEPAAPMTVMPSGPAPMTPPVAPATHVPQPGDQVIFTKPAPGEPGQ